VSSVLTARYLSPSGRGEYFLVITLAQGLAQFGNLGLHSSNTYQVARERALVGPLLANSLCLSALSGSLGAAVVIFVLGAQAGAERLWFAAFLAPAILFYMLGTNLLVGLNRIRSFNGFQLVSNYGVLLCLLVAALAGAGSRGFLAASTAGWLAVSVALLLVVRREAGGALRPDLRTFREGIRFALKAYVATLCGFLVVRSNVFLLNGLQGSEQVGYFSVASQMTDVIGILPQSTALILFPALVSARRGQFETTLRHLMTVGLLLAAGCLAVGVLAEPFIRFVFGAAFAPTVPLLRWMLPAAFFLGLTSVLSQYLAAAGFPLSLVAVWVGGSAASALLGWLLIPAWAAVGAAMALSLTQAGIFMAVFALCLSHARNEGRTTAVRQADIIQAGALP
jgi:O-antigen/teichoic acid export membrane protein